MKTHLDRLVLIAALAAAPVASEAGIVMPKQIKKPAAEASENYNSKKEQESEKEDKLANIDYGHMKEDEYVRDLAHKKHHGAGLNATEEDELEKIRQAYKVYTLSKINANIDAEAQIKPGPLDVEFDFAIRTAGALKETERIKEYCQRLDKDTEDKVIMIKYLTRKTYKNIDNLKRILKESGEVKQYWDNIREQSEESSKRLDKIF